MRFVFPSGGTADDGQVGELLVVEQFRGGLFVVFHVEVLFAVADE